MPAPDRSLPTDGHGAFYATERSWAEVVLHVLSHLESTAALPSSLFCRSYVEAVRMHLGPVQARSLGTDIATLSSLLTTHQALCHVQCMARLHRTIDAALDAAPCDLTSLHDDRYFDRAIRDSLVRHGRVAAELLRGAALLEAEHFATWPRPNLSAIRAALEAALPDFWLVAPRLRPMPVELLRPLGMRGRAWPDEIWVGVPSLGSHHDDGHPSLEHVLWQAAHEATVIEVSERASAAGRMLDERTVEHCAVWLLAQRAALQGRAKAHEQWMSSLAREVRDWTETVPLPEGLDQWLHEPRREFT